MRAAFDQASTERFAKDFGAHSTYRLLQNAVATTSVDEVALDRTVVTQTDPSMSHLIDDWKATDQKK
ncbi:MAG: aminopeptidase, partial [Nocardioidaceae bacterium]|nr:aminopeptidase [Nocardioidaceae bacterium]